MKTLAHPQCMSELIDRLRTLQPDSTRRWGRMTAHQMICHLSDACRMAIGEKRVTDATGPLQRTLVKWIALYLPLSWPGGIATRPEVDQLCEGTRPTRFAADLAELESLLRSVAARSDADWPPHPIFGKLSRGQWMRWAYRHTDHHLRQFGR
jgi:hypothetical protein